MNNPQYKSESISDTFLKRLGGLTATLSSRTGIYRLASHILRHEAVQRRRRSDLEREGIQAEMRKEKIDELFRQRKKKGGSGHPDWFSRITRVIDF